MNIIEKTDEEILAVANPFWNDLVKYSNNKNYGAFTRNFSEEMLRGAHIFGFFVNDFVSQFNKFTIFNNHFTHC
jgi:hypothetical protein